MTPTIPEIPATSNTLVLEPSFADLIRTVEQANELPEQRRRHWICSLRQIAKWRDRPVAGIPARSSSLASVKRFCHKAQQTLCGEVRIHATSVLNQDSHKNS